MLTERAQQIASENGISFSFSAHPQATGRYNLISGGKVVRKYKTLNGLIRGLQRMLDNAGSAGIENSITGLYELRSIMRTAGDLEKVLLFSGMQPNLAVDFGLFQIKFNMGQLVEYEFSPNGLTQI